MKDNTTRNQQQSNGGRTEWPEEWLRRQDGEDQSQETKKNEKK